MAHFIESVLSAENVAFRDSFLEFERRVAHAGLYTSLAQLAIKIGAPGVPDFYQGTELWTFTLVDPDNRRSIDYQHRRALLAELDSSLERSGAADVAGAVMRSPLDDRLKLFATTMMLRFRRSHRALFEAGAYEAADADGSRRDHVFGFVRALEGEHVLVVVPRLVASIVPDADAAPIGERVWGDTRIITPRAPASGCYHNVFTNRCVQAQNEAGRVTLRAADVFDQFPIAVLEAR